MGTMSLLDKIHVTPLKKISNKGGDIWHILKSSENTFYSFGEAYFSLLESRSIKAWKMHLNMNMNLVVPVGFARFVFCDLTKSFFDLAGAT